MKITKTSDDSYELLYEVEELLKKDVCVDHFLLHPETRNFQTAIQQLQSVVSEDITKCRFFPEDCCCIIEPQMDVEGKFIKIKVSKASEEMTDYMEERKREQKEQGRGYVYAKINSPFDAALVQDCYLESSIMKTTQKEYVLRVLAENISLAKLQLCEIGEIISPPRNWDILIKENAIESIKRTMNTPAS